MRFHWRDLLLDWINLGRPENKDKKWLWGTYPHGTFLIPCSYPWDEIEQTYKSVTYTGCPVVFIALDPTQKEEDAI